MNTPAQIRKLDSNIANQIAAGEVIERPAAVVKELIENAIDARATHITIRVKDGGKTFIEVVDNGFGIARDELALAIERHATSKLENLFAIASFGFRGEALPSIGAVSRLEIISKRAGEEATKISVSDGNITPPSPAHRNAGTTVTVQDLFFATPARLKFLGSDRAEILAIGDVVKRLAMAYPEIGFELLDHKDDKVKTVLTLPPTRLDARLRAILGQAELDNSRWLEAAHNGVILKGYIGLPTAAKGSASSQYFFVNNRPVRDKMFFGAVKGAYADLLPSGKYPFIVLFMEIDLDQIDVNVHPAKSEIRFHQSASVRSFVLNAIRYRLAEQSQQANTSLAKSISEGFHSPSPLATTPVSPGPTARAYQHHYYGKTQVSTLGLQAPLKGFNEQPQSFEYRSVEDGPQRELPLGLARAQFHQNYIIAETEDGIVIIDQHAAHERLIYEKLKNGYAEKRAQSQRLLVPEIISLGVIERMRLLEHAEALNEIGLEIEAFGEDAIAVQSVPSLLAKASPSKIVASVVDALDDDPGASLSKRIDEVLASIACHGSVRSGRKLLPEEMNQLLRDMEATPYSGTCNHGRPTFIKLDLKFIEARFGR